MFKKTTVIVAVLLLALVLPAVNVLAEKQQHRSVHVIDDDGGQTNMKISLNDGEQTLKLKADGEIEFADDDTGIESMGEGAEFSLTQTRDGVTRDLSAEGQADGSIDYQYSIDGNDQPFDNEGRAWLAETLPDPLAETGINVEGRIAHLLESDGHDGVIGRIHKIKGDHVRGRHIEAYSDTGVLADEELDDVLVEVREIDSDYEHRKVLVKIKQDQLTGDDADNDGPRVVKRLRKIVDASDGIDSDYELRSLLQNVHAGVDIDAEGHRVILHRAGDIGSDYELRETLSGMAVAAADDEQVAETWLKIAGKLDSDFELRQALEQLAHEQPEQESTWLGMLELAKKFSSDYECATFLTTAADNMPRTGSTEAAYRTVLESIGSDYERDRARRALGQA